MVKYLHVVPFGSANSLRVFVRVIGDVLSSKGMRRNNMVLINNKGKNKKGLTEIQAYLNEKFDTQSRGIFDLRAFFIALIKSDRIVFHELPSIKQRLLFGSFLYLLNRKVDWFVWGGDLYDEVYFSLFDSAKSGSLRLSVLRIINQFFLDRVDRIFSIRDDFDAIEVIYKSKNLKFRELYYPVPLPDISLVRPKDSKRILMCHSASRRNNHYEVLRLLKSVDDEEMEVVAILSYGEDSVEAVNSIVSEGHRIFGARFVPVLSFLDQKKYWDLLSTISISISLSKRQSSIFTTASLLSLGVKVLMYSDTSPYRFYKDNGLLVYDVDSEVLAGKFLDIDEDVMVENSLVAKKLWDPNNVNEKFEQAFSSHSR